MGKCLLWFWFSCKRQLKRPVFVLLLALVPVLAMGSKKMEQKDTDGISIGIYAEDKWTMEVARDLTSQKGMFQFYLCDSLEDLQADVASRKAECGYLLPESLKDKLDQNKFKRAVKVYLAPSTVAADLSKEVVFASLMEVYGRELLKQSITEEGLYGELPSEEAWQETEKLFDKYYNNGSTFSFVYETESGVTEEKSAAIAAFPVRGVVAVYLFVVGLFAAVTLCKDDKNGLFIPVPSEQKLWCRLAAMAAPVMMAAAACLAALAVTGNIKQAVYEAAVMVVYGIAVVVFGFLLKCLVRSPVILCSLIPFFIIGSLLLCPVFIDIGTWIPEIKILGRFFLPYYYLMAF